MNLYIIRGVSGSGKSTFAQTLYESLPQAKMIATDDFFIDDTGSYNWERDKLLQAWNWFNSQVKTDMAFGVPNIIVHNTNTRISDFQILIDYAEHFGYHVTSLVMENRHGGSSIHDVDILTLERQEQRLLGNLKLR